MKCVEVQKGLTRASFGLQRDYPFILPVKIERRHSLALDVFKTERKLQPRSKDRAGVVQIDVFQKCCLLSSPKIKPQRRVGQMGVIVLRPRADDHALIVVVVLITDVPIEPFMQP